MRVAILLSAICFVGSLGCPSPRQPVAWSDPVNGPDGSEHWIVECRRSSTNCVRQAGKACPDGYVVVERDGQSLRDVDINASSTAFGGHATVRESRNYQGSMLIKCRDPAVRPVAGATITTMPAPVQPAGVPLSDDGGANPSTELNPYGRK